MVVPVVGGAKGAGARENIGEGVSGDEEPEQLHSTSMVMLESLEKVTDEVPGIPPSPLPEHDRHDRKRATDSV